MAPAINFERITHILKSFELKPSGVVVDIEDQTLIRYGGILSRWLHGPDLSPKEDQVNDRSDGVRKREDFGD